MQLDTQLNDHYSYNVTPRQQKASRRLERSTDAGPRGITEIVSVQNRYNVEDRVLSACEARGLSFHARGRSTSAAWPRRPALARVAEQRGATPGQVALA